MVSEREKFIFYAFIDLSPVEKFENWSDCVDFGALTTARAREI